MPLMRVLTEVDEEGRIKVPANIAREMGLKPDTPVEIKVTGPARAKWITVRLAGRRGAGATTVPRASMPASIPRGGMRP